MSSYQGSWKPQLIGNPDYFEFEKPNFEPIVAIGIDTGIHIWSSSLSPTLGFKIFPNR